MTSINNFRTQDLILDFANEYIWTPQFAKTSDHYGRALQIQVTDGGVVKNQNNLQLTLVWKHKQAGNSGMDNFTAVDDSLGLFTIDYPTEILLEGSATCSVRVTDTSTNKVVATRNFTLVIEKDPLDSDKQVANDSFSALNQALNDVNDLNNLSAGTVKSLYESNPDTNAYTDNEKLKVAKAVVPVEENICQLTITNGSAASITQAAVPFTTMSLGMSTWASGTGNTLTTITVPVSGVYDISYNVQVTSTGEGRIFAVPTVGGTQLTTALSEMQMHTTARTSVNAHTTRSLVANNQIQLVLYQNSTAAQPYTAELTVRRIG
jgi:hypothetical protein